VEIWSGSWTTWKKSPIPPGTKQSTGKNDVTQRVFGITGWKNSGKTTLTERLVATLTARGWRVSTVKHAHHAFDIDKEGTDSFRHRQAGAGEVAIVSGTRWALMHELRGDDEPRLEDILARLSPCDIVLVEGYKREHHLKIEARRREGRNGAPLSAGDPQIVAIAADHPVSAETIPVFDLDDVVAIADFIEKATGLSKA
jgi:molybdopterin-guanine dinucleotide biosynthesis adapter protein